MPTAWTTNDSCTVVWETWNTSEETVDTTCTTDCWTTWGRTGRSYATTATCTASMATVVWLVWGVSSNGTTNCVTNTWRASVPAPKPRELTPEEKEARAKADAERREREAAEAAKRKAEEEAADKRAEELLVAALNDEQKAEYAKDKSFHVRTWSGRRYRVRRAWSGHVERVNDRGQAVERLCIHPRDRVPLPDNQLLAKLMLETDEERFTRIANRTPIAVGAN